MLRCVAVVVTSMLCGCVFQMGDDPVDSGKQRLGPEGGVVSLANGPTLTIPRGALSAFTDVSIVRSGAVPPAGALSAVYEFKPAETTFAHPASVSFPVPEGNPGAIVYWSSASGAMQYDNMPAHVEAGRASAQVTHLGVGYLGGAPQATRTVSGALSTVFWQDDGTKTSRNGVLGPRLTVPALFVPNGHGYDRLAIAQRPDSSFSISGVPAGRYLLQIDTVYLANAVQGEAVFSQLVELTTSTPDLSLVMAARPTVQAPFNPTSLTLSIFNLTPWVTPDAAGYSGDMILLAGSQSHVYSRPQISGPRPIAGATTYTNTYNWEIGSTGQFIGLPDAAQGDVLYVYQRSTHSVGSGASQGVVHSATRFQRLDGFTLRDGASQSLDVTLADAPQTGQARADIRNGQFAALASQVNPGARPSLVLSGGGFSVLSVPHTVDFPDAPGLSATSSVLWVQGPPDHDVDYGVVSYAQLPAPLWQEERYVAQFFDMDLPTPSGGTFPWQGGFLEFVRPASAGPVAPVLGPPRAPSINGRDAFAPQAGVGLQPTISWSPPSLGTATSYVVKIDLLWSGTPPPGLQEVAISVYTTNSVQVPAGFLQTGRQYAATITAVSAPWDTLDRAPLRFGAPVRTTDCVTAVFTP